MSALAQSELPIIGDRYQLLSELGRGGFAAVYEAFDLRLCRPVAVKVPRSSRSDPEAPRRLAREARAAAAINHPNVCSVMDVGALADGTPFLVMELLRGETLYERIAKDKQLDGELAVDVALQTLFGLHAAHELGFVHRDVKPDNVFLVPRQGATPLVKLLDFGMCKRATQPHAPPSSPNFGEQTLTRVGTVVGTPEYMSPEQASGGRVFDARIDVFAVGIVLHEALTGRRAFRGPDVRAVLSSVLTKPLVPLATARPDLPGVLDRVIGRATARDPRTRYQSAREFMRDLMVVQTILADHRKARAVTESGTYGSVNDWDMPTKRYTKQARVRA